QSAGGVGTAAGYGAGGGRRNRWWRGSVRRRRETSGALVPASPSAAVRCGAVDIDAPCCCVMACSLPEGEPGPVGVHARQDRFGIGAAGARPDVVLGWDRFRDELRGAHVEAALVVVLLHLDDPLVGHRRGVIGGAEGEELRVVRVLHLGAHEELRELPGTLLLVRRLRYPQREV